MIRREEWERGVTEKMNEFQSLVPKIKELMGHIPDGIKDEEFIFFLNEKDYKLLYLMTTIGLYESIDSFMKPIMGEFNISFRFGHH